jgi:hypothetical protein
MKQRILRPFAILASALCLNGLAFINSVFACECHSRNNFEHEFSFSKSVFVGEVVEIDKSTSDAIVTLKVEKIWKGNKSETIVIRTNNQGKACGFSFKQGEKYLIYAYDDGVLRTSICTRTTEIKSAGNDLKELAKKKEL